MAIPAHSASSHRYLYISALTDCNNIITSLRSELVTYGGCKPGPAARFISPVDAYSRYYKVVVTCPSTYTLQFVVSDQYRVTIDTRQIQINNNGSVGSATDVAIYSGHISWVHSMRGSGESQVRHSGPDPAESESLENPDRLLRMRSSSGSVTGYETSFMSISGTTATNGKRGGLARLDRLLRAAFDILFEKLQSVLQNRMHVEVTISRMRRKGNA